MGRRGKQPSGRTEAGFSMIEMLMVAVIMAVGIMGVSMMQVMALKAMRGSRSVTSGAQVASRILDQVEEEGRLTWLNTTDSGQTVPTALTGLQYINLAAAITQYYDSDGSYLGTSSANPHNFYTVGLTPAAVPAATGTVGGMTDFTVVVSWADSVGANARKVQRNVTLVRRIVHG